jgi:uncharacterized protein DUF4339
MSNLWYCEDRGESIGPLSIFELKAFLTRAADGNSVLVWREGMANWQSAGEVPELVASIAVPLLPTSVRPSASGASINPSDKKDDGIRSPKSKSRSASFLYSLLCIALVGGGLRFLSEESRTATSPDLTKPISGSARDAFVKEGAKTCLGKQESDPENRSLAISKEKLMTYCSCYINSLADIVTYGDMSVELPKDGSIPPWLQGKIASLGSTCADQLRKGLLGG